LQPIYKDYKRKDVNDIWEYKQQKILREKKIRDKLREEESQELKLQKT